MAEAFFEGDPLAFERRTARMRLRLLRPTDRAEFVRSQTASRAHLAPWSPSLAEMGLDEDGLFEQQLARAHGGFAQSASLRLTGFLDDGRIAGHFALNNVVRGVFQNADASWQVSAEVVRQGYASEAVGAMLALAFARRPPAGEGLGLHRVQAAIIPENVASLAVAARCGLRREGLAQRYLRIAGRWQDHVIFARTAEE